MDEKVIDLVIPTLGRPHISLSFSLLRHIPWPVRNHIVVEGTSWPQATNLGLEESRGDVLLMDDDVFLKPGTLAPLLDPGIFNQADIFGFKLNKMDETIQHAGGYWTGQTVTHYGYGEKDRGQYDAPRFVAHVTTSLCYIKRHVFDKIGHMALDMPGMQCEDIDFCFRAIKAGFKILYCGGMGAGHMESASKRHLDRFSARTAENWEEVRKRHLEDASFLVKLQNYHNNVITPLILA